MKSTIDQSRLLNTIRLLSSDEYEGRAPGTRGEDLTVAYLEEQFKVVGLLPGNPDGTFIQSVPMVGMNVDPHAELVFTNPTNGQQERLKYVEDFVVWTKREQPAITIDSDLVFVGYGIVAPEYNWDDFKGVDMTGKIMVVLVNDPPVPDPNDPTKLDEKTFKGKAMTYYGRWTYKCEQAAELGASGCLIVHKTEPAGYPWGTVKSSWSGEQCILQTTDLGMGCCAVEGWISYDKTKELFAMASQDFDELQQAAVSRDFRPVDLHIQASLTLNTSIRHFVSKNVVGRLAGADPTACDECVVYTAHWDHLGVDHSLDGDKIFHGAVDNASGVAGIIELADLFRHAAPLSRRSILFIATTGEERGLLGAEFYTRHPLYPVTQTLANINVDGLNVLGLTTDVQMIGFGQSTLDEVLQEVAQEQKREVVPDNQPEKGHFYRADHVCFAKVGIPAFSLQCGVHFIGKPEGWGRSAVDKYIQDDYHRPSDMIKPEWDLSGTAQDLLLLAEVGYRIANGDSFPTWKAGSEFKTKRDETLTLEKAPSQ
jgi:Zn-dependent M28 family amino/carboxypeptidase